jgi:hypothetical protein
MQPGRIFTVLMLLTLLFLIACQTQAFVDGKETPVPIEVSLVQREKTSIQSSPTPALTDSDYRNNTARMDRGQREAYEKQILASVVRLDVIGPSKSDPAQVIGEGGHGTIIDGRYLIVHNHFDIDLSVFADEGFQECASLTMYSASGYLILREMPPPLFKIIIEEAETLVLDFGTNDEGLRFFDWFRVPSAPFMSWHELELLPGMEVAQVNWDGKRTQIDWITVLEVITTEGTPRLMLDNPIAHGSSGGGIFWKGFHIANNWKLVHYMSENNSDPSQYSIAALNSERVAAISFLRSGDLHSP